MRDFGLRDFEVSLNMLVTDEYRNGYTTEGEIIAALQYEINSFTRKGRVRGMRTGLVGSVRTNDEFEGHGV